MKTRKPNLESTSPADLLARAEANAEVLAAAGEPELAGSTLNAYERDWAVFADWCDQADRTALPANVETVVEFLLEIDSGSALGTAVRRLAAIRWMHFSFGHTTPTQAVEVKRLLDHVRRSSGDSDRRQGSPALPDDLRRIVDVVDPDSHRGYRDRAVVLLGFCGALKGSELVALNVADIADHGDAMSITVASSEGDWPPVKLRPAAAAKYCAVAALRAWLDLRPPDGPLFVRFHRNDSVGHKRLTRQSVSLLVKEYAKLAGLDFNRYSGSSLRHGYFAAVARSGGNLLHAAAHGRLNALNHLRRYVDERDTILDRWTDHPGKDLL